MERGSFSVAVLLCAAGCGSRSGFSTVPPFDAGVAVTQDAGVVAMQDAGVVVMQDAGVVVMQDAGLVVRDGSDCPSGHAFIEVAPKNGAVGVRRDEVLVATIPCLSRETITPESFHVYGDQSGFYEGTIDTSRGDTVVFRPFRSFRPGERVTASIGPSVANRAHMPSGPFVWQFVIGSAASSGRLTMSPMPFMADYVALGDLDGDGDLDVWNGSERLDNEAWLNDGRGGLRRGWAIDRYNRTQDVALGDVDGDGDLDAVTVYGVNLERIFFNDGSAQFPSGQGLLTGGSNGVALGDLDGDGDLDMVIAAEGPLSIVWRNEGGGMMMPHAPLAKGDAFGVALGDLDGDGDLDVFLAGTVPLVVLNDGTGHFPDTIDLSAVGPAFRVALGDLDGDGDVDAVIAGPNVEHQVLLNDGRGHFRAAEDSGIPAEPTGAVALGDVDGDGDLDVLLVTNLPSLAALWTNDGAARFHDTGFRLPMAAYPGTVAFGDLDGDGDLDAITSTAEWLNGVVTP